MNKQTEALKRALVDEDGENRAVRWFLAAYRNPGMSVGGMKAHLKLSGYPLWPDWVERCHPSEHLTKAGAQLWIRHLFSLEATPPNVATPLDETASLAAQDLQTELEATNRQVEILSDALAESRREVAALKAAQEPKKFDPNDSFERDEAARNIVREFMRNH